MLTSKFHKIVYILVGEKKKQFGSPSPQLPLVSLSIWLKRKQENNLSDSSIDTCLLLFSNSIQEEKMGPTQLHGFLCPGD